MFISVPELLRQLPAVPVLMFGKEITPTTAAKDLGLYVGQPLTYNDHITKSARARLHPASEFRGSVFDLWHYKPN